MTTMMEQEIIEILKQSISDQEIAGVSAAFLVKGEVHTYVEGMQGMIPPFDQQTLTKDMLYDIASLTKVIATTTRILQLVDEGKLRYDTRIHTIVKAMEPSCLTIQHALCHRSGYPADIEGKYHMHKEALLKAIYEAPHVTTIDSHMQYSDINFILLGNVIEIVDGCSLEASFQKHIFQVLDMRSTSYEPDVEQALFVPSEIHPIRGLIQGCVHDHKTYVLGQSGSAGLFSTLRDICIFVKAFLAMDEKILSKRRYQELQTIELDKRTYGWDKRFGEDWFYHTGFSGTSILCSIKQQRAIILLTNRIHPTREKISYLATRDQIHDVFRREI